MAKSAKQKTTKPRATATRAKKNITASDPQTTEQLLAVPQAHEKGKSVAAQKHNWEK